MKVFAVGGRVVSVDADLGTTSGLEAGVGYADQSKALNVGVAEPADWSPQSADFPLSHPLGLANDPAWAAPTVVGAILQLGKLPYARRTAQTMTDPGVNHRRPKPLDQNRVLSQA